MNRILKADFRKFLSGKLFIVMMVLLVVFPLLSSAFLSLVFKGLGENFDIGMSAETAFYSSFSPLNNYGLMLMIFMIIILLADFNQNTIRNKVVAGYSKEAIYLSGTIFTLTIAFLAMTAYSFLNYALTKAFLGSAGVSFGNILKHWLVAILATLFLYAFLQLLVYSTKSFLGAFGILFAVLLFLNIIFFALFSKLGSETMRIILIFLPPLQLSGSFTLYDSNFIWMILANLVFTGLAIGIGLYLNRRLDFK